ncbi:MAG: hypothetical protein AAFZ80_06370 [Cyanobacteria bacterium P01_A01_bin.105]
MFRSSKLDLNNLEFLVRTALTNGELSPGVAAEITRYRVSSHLSADAVRYLAILDDAIADGCVQPVGSVYSHEGGF